MPDGKVVGTWLCRTSLKPCEFCSDVSTRQCDYKAAPGEKTCDANICDDCATSGGKNIDYCPRHKDVAPTQGGLF